MKNRRGHAVSAAASVVVSSFSLAILATASVNYASVANSTPAVWASGTTGTWTTPGNWTAGDGVGTTSGLPGTDQNIEIDNGQSTSSVVTDNYGSLTTYGVLVISAGNTLQASGSAGTLSLDDGNSNNTTGVSNAQLGLANAGTIKNISGAWTIDLGGNYNQNSPSDYSTNTGTIENSGSGTLTLYQNTTVFPLSPGIVNTGGTIENTGSGTLSINALKVTGGTVSNGSNGTLSNYSAAALLQLVGVTTFNNAGTIAFANTPGGAFGGTAQILASGGTAFTNSKTVTFNFAGTGTATAGADILVIGSGSSDTSSLTNTSTGTITIEDTSTVASSSSYAQLQLNTGGAIHNDGTINITTSSANGESASIVIGANTTVGNTASATGSVVFNDNASNYVGAISGNPTLTIGSGQTWQGAVKLGNGAIGIINNGTINANGSNPIVISTHLSSFTNNGTLHASGAGGIEISDPSFSNAGTLQVDDVAGAGRTLADSGSLTFTAGGYAAQIDSDNLTSGQIAITGDLALGSNVATLSVSDVGSTTLPAGDVFTLITASSSSGNFAGYPQGSDITVGANTFAISYAGGANNEDVTLTSIVPEPGTGALLALGSLCLLQRRRRQAIAR